MPLHHWPVGEGLDTQSLRKTHEFKQFTLMIASFFPKKLIRSEIQGVAVILYFVRVFFTSPRYYPNNVKHATSSPLHNLKTCANCFIRAPRYYMVPRLVSSDQSALRILLFMKCCENNSLVL